MSIKVCRTCGNHKELAEFTVHDKQRNRYKLDCKVCVNDNQNKKRAGQPRVAESLEYRAKNRDKLNAKNKQHRLKNPVLYRNYHLLRRYGITLAQYNDMYEKQKGLCAICNKPGKLVVDHNHKTGKVRGLLHGACNRGLGFFKDEPEIALSAASYLATDGVF